MGYQPIEKYGVIGNMRTVALVGMNGSIDWLAWPQFDSPSIFAALHTGYNSFLLVFRLATGRHREFETTSV